MNDQFEFKTLNAVVGKLRNSPAITFVCRLGLGSFSPHFKNSDVEIFNEISHGIIGFNDCATELAREFYDHKMQFREFVNCEP